MADVRLADLSAGALRALLDPAGCSDEDWTQAHRAGLVNGGRPYGKRRGLSELGQAMLAALQRVADRLSEEEARHIAFEGPPCFPTVLYDAAERGLVAEDWFRLSLKERATPLGTAVLTLRERGNARNLRMNEEQRTARQRAAAWNASWPVGTPAWRNDLPRSEVGRRVLVHIHGEAAAEGASVRVPVRRAWPPGEPVEDVRLDDLEVCATVLDEIALGLHPDVPDVPALWAWAQAHGVQTDERPVVGMRVQYEAWIEDKGHASWRTGIGALRLLYHLVEVQIERKVDPAAAEDPYR